jgi:hypothetical protein
MAAPRVAPAPAPTSGNARAGRRVFSVRLTAEERAWLERAAASKYPRSGRSYGRFLRWALGLAFDEVLGRRR